jgi:hypothetical protein
VATDFRRHATSIYVNSLEISIEMKSLVIPDRGNTIFPDINNNVKIITALTYLLHGEESFLRS